MDNSDYAGHGLYKNGRELTLSANSAINCQAGCSKTSGCDVWTWDGNNLCFPKNKEAIYSKKTKNEHISGPKKCKGNVLQFSAILICIGRLQLL
jgi:hypothetical protein